MLHHFISIIDHDRQYQRFPSFFQYLRFTKVALVKLSTYDLVAKNSPSRLKMFGSATNNDKSTDVPLTRISGANIATLVTPFAAPRCGACAKYCLLHELGKPGDVLPSELRRRLLAGRHPSPDFKAPVALHLTVPQPPSSTNLPSESPTEINTTIITTTTMSPHPMITPAPKLPAHPARLRGRQFNSDDPYGLSSLMDKLNSQLLDYSSLYDDYFSLYSYDPDDISSLVDYYASLYSIPDLTFPVPTATAQNNNNNNNNNNPLATSTTAASNENNDNGGGMSTGAKIGLGVGIPLAIALLAGIGIFIWYAGRRKGKKNNAAAITPSPQPQLNPSNSNQAFAQQQPFQQPPQQPPQQPMGYVNHQGYMQGFPQPTQSPPPQYGQQAPPEAAQQQPYRGAYDPYAKGARPGAVEMEQEYHFARPGVVEMGDGVSEHQQQRRK
ncbi:hypothetical protein CC78DRAFT_611197 [Lojkania enalia]|uniref:Mid2 domain-containing protein n=1 Tax=Lojkania enalia TaxID=147567 RepID=A0A9P4NDL3_9PLEO|nr:hypothetical protein CC78DRAFT_611197 [Didymosphaeria enalia]